MGQYILTELPEGFDEPPTFQATPRPGGSTTGVGLGGGSWGPSAAPSAVGTSQGGGAILGGGMSSGDSSWLPTSMLPRGTK